MSNEFKLIQTESKWAPWLGGSAIISTIAALATVFFSFCEFQNKINAAKPYLSLQKASIITKPTSNQIVVNIRNYGLRPAINPAITVQRIDLEEEKQDAQNAQKPLKSQTIIMRSRPEGDNLNPQTKQLLVDIPPNEARLWVSNQLDQAEVNKPFYFLFLISWKDLVKEETNTRLFQVKWPGVGVNNPTNEFDAVSIEDEKIIKDYLKDHGLNKFINVET